ncbi:hypothetical protein [Enterobacter sp. RHBSTW-00175]|nr:hypothetical protein [Enterobacter sp. RHBSTW-00175]QMR77993.1 hypothetical protein HV107_21335 [Enterobacter sp. RHBSTW-00175]
MPHQQTILYFLSRHAGMTDLMLLSAVAVVARASYTGPPWWQELEGTTWG